MLFFLLPLLAFASGPCEEMSSSEMESVEFQSGIKIVACGERAKGRVSALTIIKIQGKETTNLIEGDEAFKSYEVRKNAKSLLVTEALSSQGSKPFLGIEISCEGKTCKKTESCLWKKAKISEAEIQKLENVLRSKSSISDSDWEKAFYAVLNGSMTTEKLFGAATKGEQSHAAGSEAFETFKIDIQRLKKVHCL